MPIDLNILKEETEIEIRDKVHAIINSKEYENNTNVILVAGGKYKFSVPLGQT